MKPSAHLVTSAMMAAAIYAQSQTIPEAAACLVSGVMIDLDHLADFLMFSRERFSIRNFFSWCYDSRWKRMTVILHSYELIATLAAAAHYLGNPLLKGITLGAALHLLLDQSANIKGARLSPWYYFLAYRSAMGFRRDKMQQPLPLSNANPNEQEDAR